MSSVHTNPALSFEVPDQMKRFLNDMNKKIEASLKDVSGPEAFFNDAKTGGCAGDERNHNREEATHEVTREVTHADEIDAIDSEGLDETDVRLVMHHAGVSWREAVTELRRAGGDVADAVIYLTVDTW